jgi:hypothetical protein
MKNSSKKPINKFQKDEKAISLDTNIQSFFETLEPLVFVNFDPSYFEAKFKNSKGKNFYVEKSNEKYIYPLEFLLEKTYVEKLEERALTISIGDMVYVSSEGTSQICQAFFLFNFKGESILMKHNENVPLCKLIEIKEFDTIPMAAVLMTDFGEISVPLEAVYNFADLSQKQYPDNNKLFKVKETSSLFPLATTGGENVFKSVNGIFERVNGSKISISQKFKENFEDYV